MTARQKSPSTSPWPWPLAAAVALALAVGIGLGLATWPVPPRVAPVPPVPPLARYQPLAFAALDGWAGDDHAAALRAFRKTCAHRLTALPAGRRLARAGPAQTAGDWAEACAGAARTDDAAARQFFESAFAAFRIVPPGGPGLITGYFEPTLRGSRRRGAPARTPLYRPPPELISVDLGRFRDDLSGRRIAGVVRGGRLLPMADRAAIVAGALAGRGLELVFIDDPIDAFFLHIQGSGQVLLDDGGRMRIGYAGQNGHAYFAIGRELIARGALDRRSVSMQSIRAWLRANPGEAAAVMHKNRSFVFFREIAGPGPIGAAGVDLTPGRSLAIDRRYVPLGAPVWLQASHPDPDPAAPDRPLRRLLIAQDVGGAIRGAGRGDVFWGAGADAAAIAGRMKATGEMIVLLPKSVR